VLVEQDASIIVDLSRAVLSAALKKSTLRVALKIVYTLLIRISVHNLLQEILPDGCHGDTFRGSI